MNIIYNEDCLLTLARNLVYDYVFCVPPDFAELGMDPGNHSSYYTWLLNILSKLVPTSRVVTIAITDRKFKSTIIPKHAEIIKIMQSLNYSYIAQKLWSRTAKRNLYRLTYTFVMSFTQNRKPRQAHQPAYEYDIWHDAADSYGRFPFGIATEVVKRCILNFTQPGETVYDCFSGSGTTASAAILSGRRYIGSEISKEYYELSQKRLAERKDFFNGKS